MHLLSLALALLLSGCTSLIFHPDSHQYSVIESYERDEYFIESSEGFPLHALHVRAPSQAKGLIFIAHGNAQNLSAHILDWIWLLDEGYDLFIFDYRGYGKSGGNVGLEGSIDDTRKALHFAATLNKELITIGQSLGGALLICALEQEEELHVKMALIDSTFSDLGDIGAEVMARSVLSWPFQWSAHLLLSNACNPVEHIAELEMPLLFVAGSNDTMISPNHSWQLFDAATPPKMFWLVEKAGHINAFVDPKMRHELLEHFENGLKPQPYSVMRIYDNLDKITPIKPKGVQ